MKIGNEQITEVGKERADEEFKNCLKRLESVVQEVNI